MESYKKIRETVKIGYYQGLRVIKGLNAKPWDDWYIINRDNHIVGVAGDIVGIAGECCTITEFVSTGDSEVRETKIREIEIEVIA